MTWSPLDTVILVLLLALCVLLLVIVHLLDTRGAPSRRQRRAWERDRLRLPTTRNIRRPL